MRSALSVLAVVLAAVGIGYLLGSKPDEGQRGNSAPASDPSRASATTQTGTDGPTFWDLVADTRVEAGNDTGRQSELLEERLSRLPAKQIVDFQRNRRRLDERAYTWDLWGAAYVIEDGCSDDCFRDFRGYLISLGREAYAAAMRDPDSLAPIVQDAEQGDWENADDVAPDAYGSATGEDFPLDDSDVEGDPRGEPWDDEDVEALVQRYPALAERFR
jgi:hypothetical protein